MLSQRTEAAICVALAVPVAAAYPWDHKIGLAGAVLLAFSLVSLVIGLRRSPEHRRQERPIRELHRLVRRLPRGQVWHDPQTAQRFMVERRRRFVTLVVMDPPGPGATATRYRIGWWGNTSPPPLIKHIAPVEDSAAADIRFISLAYMTRFNRHTGLLESTAEDLIELRKRLSRAVETSDVKES